MSTPGTINFPASLDDADSLIRAANNAGTTLTAGVGTSDTALNVVSTAAFSATGAVTVDGEVMFFTAKTSTTLTVIRGADGTAAAAHASGAAVEMLVIAADHNTLANAVIQVETKLGTGGVNGQVAYWSGSPVALAGNASLAWDAANGLSVTAGASNKAQLLVHANSSAYSAAVELEDAFTTPNRWWLALGTTTATDGRLCFYDARQGQVRMTLDTNGNIGINTTSPNSAALLDLSATDRGLLLPRMTTTQRNAITALAGLVIYNTTTNKINVYTGSAWEAVTSA